MNIIVNDFWKNFPETIEKIKTFFHKEGYKIEKIKFSDKVKLCYIHCEKNINKKWILIYDTGIEIDFNFVLLSEKEYKKKYNIPHTL
jgi:hypothetical protein